MCMSDLPNGCYRVSAKAVILDKDKRFLLCLEDNGLWELPGGAIDFGETAKDCLIRELKEEMGVEVTVIGNRPVYFVTAKNINGVWKACVLYLVEVANLNFTKSDECQEIRFFNKEEAMKQKLYPIVEEFIKEFDPENHKY
jgi:8-oxo-dGTP diphosphatase